MLVDNCVIQGLHDRIKEGCLLWCETRFETCFTFPSDTSTSDKAVCDAIQVNMGSVHCILTKTYDNVHVCWLGTSLFLQDMLGKFLIATLTGNQD